MLVSVALIVLMMSLFAEVFTIATGTMSRQKGLTENDQRARMLMTLVKADLDKRSFRSVVPYGPGDDPPVGTRDGYFYIAENDPQNDTDDVLQFTVKTNQSTSTSVRQDPIYGRAATLIGGGSNQPVFDDGDPTNAKSLSVNAEVAYFLRKGKLYRRTLLIRTPPNAGYQAAPQTGATPPADVITGPYSTSYTTNGTGNFLTDFDFSAHFDPTPDAASGQVKFNAVANGINSLDNNQGSPASLGLPWLRFGHRPGGTGSQSGKPVEFIGTNFIGRFTHEETSNIAFGYPGVAGAGPDGIMNTADDTNPYTRTGLSLDANGAVSAYAGGPREAVDLLLSNVHAFDVKVWDPKASSGPDGNPGFASQPGADDDSNGTFNDNTELGWPNSDDGAWRDIGHSGATGSFQLTANRGWGVDGAPGTVGVDDDGNGSTDDAGESGWTGTDDYGNRFDTWHPLATLPSTPYQIFIREPANFSAWTASTPYSLNTFVFRPGRYSLIYKCTTAGTSGAAQPTWTTTAGSTMSDGSVVWTAVANLQPLTAIQIRIRFYDVSSALMRELTILQSLAP
jgi:hypothetical protein